MPSGTQRSSEMFAGPGAMFTVVFGQRKWYCDCFTSPTGTKGTLPLPLSADALIGPIWLENVGEIVSA